jgi:hypothetical protein
LVARLVVALADTPLRSVGGTVDLLVVLMVGLAVGDPRHFRAALPARLASMQAIAEVCAARIAPDFCCLKTISLGNLAAASCRDQGGGPW